VVLPFARCSQSVIIVSLYVPNIIIYSTQQQQKKEKEKEEEGAVVALSFVWFPLDNTLFVAPDIQY